MSDIAENTIYFRFCMASVSAFLPKDARMAADLIVSIFDTIHSNAYVVETVGHGQKQLPIQAIVQDTTAQLMELKMTGLLPMHNNEHHVKFLEMGTSAPEGSTVDVGAFVSNSILVLRIHHGRAAPRNVTYHLPGVAGDFVDTPDTRSSRGLVTVLVDTFQTMFYKQPEQAAQLHDRLLDMCTQRNIAQTCIRPLQRQVSKSNAMDKLDDMQKKCAAKRKL